MFHAHRLQYQWRYSVGHNAQRLQLQRKASSPLPFFYRTQHHQSLEHPLHLSLQKATFEYLSDHQGLHQEPLR